MAERANLTVTIVLPYDEALRLSFMARFPAGRGPIDRGSRHERDRIDADNRIADKVDAAIKRAEESGG